MPRILLAFLILLAACGESPTEPRRVSVLRLFCDTAGVNVQCRATTQDYRGAPIADVTGGNPPWLDVRLKRAP